MSRPAWKRRAAFVAALAATAAAGWGVAAFRAARLGETPAPKPHRPEPTAREYAVATQRVTGTLTPAALAHLAPRAADGRGVLVLLRKRDCLVCEDLGRQMRELVAHSPDRPLLVLADPDALATVQAFLHREHLHVPAEAAPVNAVVQGQDKLPTPAVLVERGPEGAVEGIAHPHRFPNLRVRSFTEELGPLLR
jgi:hypothetical protein